MKRRVLLLAWLLLALSSPSNAATTITVTDNGDPAGAGTCPAACSLRQAIAVAANGDTIAFAPGLVSPINLSLGELLIDKTLTIQGPGATVLTVSAQNLSRVFNITAAATLGGLQIADGVVSGANGTPGATGSGNGGAGGPGGTGGSVAGGCLLVASGGTVVLDRMAVRHCNAIGGMGGQGGTGAYGDVGGGFGGNGGSGGTATGGAIAVSGTLSLLDSSVVDAHAIGGTGGYGGSAGPGGTFPGIGGGGGSGGPTAGGAVQVTGSASLRIANSTIAASSAAGGAGGLPGGNVFGPPPPGGGGGSATGGLVQVAGGASLVDLEFSTLVGGTVAGGASGTTGGGAGPATGNAISAGATVTALSSVVVGAQAGVSVCAGSVGAAAGSANLSEDTSCSGFTLHQTFAQLFHPLDAQATPWPGYLPLYRSAAIDAAASCQDLGAQTVGVDQHGISRPQGNACDLGAIEADYLFVDGFE